MFEASDAACEGIQVSTRWDVEPAEQRPDPAEGLVLERCQ
jgi:hypothetical protein